MTKLREYKKQNLDFDPAVLPIQELFSKMESRPEGLTTREALRRFAIYGPNDVYENREKPVFWDIVERFKNPFVLLLLAMAVLSFFFGNQIGVIVIVFMIVTNIALSFFQERKAESAAKKLQEIVETNCTVIRENFTLKKSLKYIVPGDIVSLRAGDIIPGDIRIIASNDLFVNQSSLTGESLPVEKFSECDGKVCSEPSKVRNMAFMGSSVVSGIGKGMVVRTGAYTSFGEISKKLAEMRNKTLFEKQTADFTIVMIRIIALVVTVILGIFALKHRGFAESLLFAVAIAVQITPETLPMVATLNLSRGALDMSKKKVIVKRLSAIQNFGAMDVLCSDKTGTLTQNEVVLEKHINVRGEDDENVFTYAYVNAFFQKGIKTLLNSSIVKHERKDLHDFTIINEVPFDFERKINSVIAKKKDVRIIALGAPEEIIKRCTKYEDDGKEKTLQSSEHEKILEPYYSFSKQGFRVLAVAYKEIDERTKAKGYSTADESDLILRGYLAFLDPAKPSAKKAVDTLRSVGIDFKIITGDSELVTEKICADLGIPVGKVVLGTEFEHLSEEGLSHLCEEATIFARMTPEQKERIIRILRARGHVVGYLGDGINDALSLRAADIGISVNNAVDVAKESASIVLLEKDLQALADGILEGRKVFTNFMNYIHTVSMVNVSYMISFIGGALFLPFLPMSPLQVLLNNYLFEVTQTAYPSDNVDKENLRVPHRWKIRSLVKFMILFGAIFAIFNFITFWILWFVFGGNVNVAIFQTGWFIETLFAEILLIFVIRTKKIPFKKSEPSKFLVGMVGCVLALVLVLPFTPLAPILRLSHMPALFYLLMCILVCTFLTMVWFVKNWFLKRVEE